MAEAEGKAVNENRVLVVWLCMPIAVIQRTPTACVHAHAHVQMQMQMKIHTAHAQLLQATIVDGVVCLPHMGRIPVHISLTTKN